MQLEHCKNTTASRPLSLMARTSLATALTFKTIDMTEQAHTPEADNLHGWHDLITPTGGSDPTLYSIPHLTSVTWSTEMYKV